MQAAASGRFPVSHFALVAGAAGLGQWFSAQLSRVAIESAGYTVAGAALAVCGCAALVVAWRAPLPGASPRRRERHIR
jgi:hypothetical protein